MFAFSGMEMSLPWGVIIGVTGAGGAATYGSIGYGIGYGSATLLMGVFPRLKNKQSYFLASPTFKSQSCFFLGTGTTFTAAYVVAKSLAANDSDNEHISSRPRSH